MSILVRTNLVNALNKKMASLLEQNVYVGIPSDKSKRDNGPITNPELGYIHEKGSPARNIPPRPFLIPGVEEAGDRVSKVLGASAINITNDDSVEVGLNKAGLIASQSVKNRIVKSIGIEGLKESTIKARERRKSRKRSGVMKPLIDTGQMLNSITYVVE